jgi:hypothetical protein
LSNFSVEFSTGISMDIIKTLLSHFFICMEERSLLDDDNGCCSFTDGLLGGGGGPPAPTRPPVQEKPIPLSTYSAAASSNSYDYCNKVVLYYRFEATETSDN